MKSLLSISLKITMFRHDFLSCQLFMTPKKYFSDINPNIPEI